MLLGWAEGVWVGQAWLWMKGSCGRFSADGVVLAWWARVARGRERAMKVVVVDSGHGVIGGFKAKT